jgi:hypothetical protein
MLFFKKNKKDKSWVKVGQKSLTFNIFLPRVTQEEYKSDF